MKRYSNFYKGIGLSKNVQNNFDDMINADVWDEIGVLKCQKALAKESGTTVDKPCYRAVAPNGDTYFFSQTDGAIFKRTQAGVYSSVRTNANGAHKGATYYRGKIYYATDDKLGVFDLSTTWNDNYQVLTAGVPHALDQFDLIMYVTNGKDIAQLDDADVFSTSGLDLPTEHISTALIPFGDDLLTLSNPGDYINDSSIFRWNTYSDSWTIKDSIKETDVYAFLDADNNVYVICQSGAVYFYNGSTLQPFSFIKNPYSTTGHQLTTNFQGRPLVANGGRIYSLYRKSNDLDVALVGEYTCSAGEDATIYSIVANGSDLLVSWGKDGTYGVDNISSDYATAKIITPRFTNGYVVRVAYEDLNGGSISIESKLDGSSTWKSHSTFNDNLERREVRNTNDILIRSGAQARITLTPDPEDKTTTPIVNEIIVNNL